MLRSVAEAGRRGVEARNHPWHIKSADWFTPSETLRALFASMIHADKNQIAIVPAVSYGMAVAARNIPLSRNQHVLLLDQEYPSNVYAWREACKRAGASIVTVTKEPAQTWTEAVLQRIDNNTGVVSIGHCHWTDGSLVDLLQLSKEVKRVGARLVVDASQSAGAFPIDVDKIKPDFLMTVGYKWLLGPYGLGYLYADEEYTANGTPIEYSWLNKRGSEDFARLVQYQDAYREGARRFDAGETPSFVHMPMAIAALAQITAWGIDNIQETLAILTRDIERRAAERNLRTPPQPRVGHMIGIAFNDARAAILAKALPERNVFVSFRGSSMRVSPYLFNTQTDIERLFAAIDVMEG